MKTDIAVIGGGASGMIAAYAAGKCGAKVTVLEKMPRPGRKIMISGKGRCNVTNLKDWNSFSGHIHPKANFLKNAFYNFTSADTVEFFKAHGLETVTERGDRVFPASYRAMDVVDALQAAVKKAGGDILTGAEAADICKSQEGFTVRLASGEVIAARKAIIATGGLSYPGTGSTGDGYRWAETLGHEIKHCFPSLTALVPAGYKTAGGHSQSRGHISRETPLSDLGQALIGNQLKNVGLTVKIDGNTAEEEFGDIDFTDGGLEGPAGFKISRKCVKAIENGSKVCICLDLKPAVKAESLERRIQSLWEEIIADPRSKKKSGRERMQILLGKLMPVSLIGGFLKFFPDADVRSLGARLKNWEFRIAGYVGYERCVVTAGGVSTEEVSQKTMESKLVPGLYFAGEILDLDGDTGGYNLQTAFSTGFLAGESAAKSLALDK